MTAEDKPINYLDALNRYGLKFCLRYLIETHFFDIRYGIETKERIYPSAYKGNLQNLEHGKAYMPAWTSEIKRSFDYVFSTVKDINEYSFIDIGCGKGKVVIIWQLLSIKHGIELDIYGVDYYREVIQKAKENYRKVFGIEGNFLEEDAASLSCSEFGEKNIFFLYNPFDQYLLDKFLGTLENHPAYIIYNNPQHGDELVKHGFEAIHEHDEGIESLKTSIFHRASS